MINPNDEGVWVELGNALLPAGQPGKSMQAFFTALAINRRNYSALYYLGQIFQRAGKHGDAGEAFAMVLRNVNEQDKTSLEAAAGAQREISKLLHGSKATLDWNTCPFIDEAHCALRALQNKP